VFRERYLFVSGVVAGDRWPILPPPKFQAVGKLSKKLFPVGKSSSKNAKFGVEKRPVWEHLGAKLKLSAPMANLFCRKIATFLPIFLTHDAAVVSDGR